MCSELQPFTPLQQDILSESFNAFEHLLQRIVEQHHATYGGDFDDLFSEAQEIFLNAHQQHDEMKGKIGTWIYFFVSKRLLEKRRKDNRLKKHIKSIPLNHAVETEEDLELKVKRKDLEILLSEVGEDCKNIIYLILFPPKDFEEEFSKHKKPKYCKNFIMEYLHFDMKWHMQRIKNAFNELKEVLEEL